MPSNSPLVSFKTSLSVGIWRQTTWDQTPALPLSVVGPWSGVDLCQLNQKEEALGAGKGGKVGGLGTWCLETWAVATCWRNISGEHGGSSLAIILRDTYR